MIAAFVGDLALVQMLVDVGARVDATDGRGLTARQYALIKWHQEVVHILEHSHRLVEPSSRPASPPTLLAC